MTRLERIKEREQKATKGPWEAEFTEGMDSVWHDIVLADTGKELLNGETGMRTEIVRPDYAAANDSNLKEIRETLEFVAHSRADIPWLLERLREAQKIIGSVFQQTSNVTISKDCAGWLRRMEEE